MDVRLFFVPGKPKVFVDDAVAVVVMRFLDVGRVEILSRDATLDLDLIQYGELLRLGPRSEPVGRDARLALTGGGAQGAGQRVGNGGVLGDVLY